MFQWEEKEEEEEEEEVVVEVVDKAERRGTELFVQVLPAAHNALDNWAAVLSQEQTWKLNERAGNAFNPFQTSQSLSFPDFILGDKTNRKSENH